MQIAAVVCMYNHWWEVETDLCHLHLFSVPAGAYGCNGLIFEQLNNDTSITAPIDLHPTNFYGLPLCSFCCALGSFSVVF